MDVHPHLRVDTPEQIALEFPVAGIGSRFLAMAVDTVLQAVLYLIIGAIAAAAFGVGLSGLFEGIADSAMAFLPAILILLIFGIYWGYFVAFEIAWRGQTPGKRAAGLRVIRDTGRPVDAAAIVVRNLLRAIDGLPAFYGVGLVCMMLNRQSKRLGDFAAGTIVIHDRRPERLDMAWVEDAAAASTAGAPAGGSARLTDAEVVLIETFLQRRNELEWRARDRSAERIAGRLQERLGIAPEPGQTIEQFLEQLARAARDSARYR